MDEDVKNVYSPQMKHNIEELTTTIYEVLGIYTERLPYSVIIGVLDIIKMSTFSEMIGVAIENEEEDDDDILS